MARQFPIKNGRLTTDLDADGHRINNLPGGKESVPWDNVTGKPIFSKVATSGSYNDLLGKPVIPPAVNVDAALSDTSTNPVQNRAVKNAVDNKVDKVAGKGLSSNDYTDAEKAALARKRDKDDLSAGWRLSGIPDGYVLENGPAFEPPEFEGDMASWSVTFVSTDGLAARITAWVRGYDLDGTETELTLHYSDGAGGDVVAVRERLAKVSEVPTNTSQLVNDSGFLTEHQDVSGKLDSAAVYPAWEDKPYNTGDVVSYKGRLFRCGVDGSNEPPAIYPNLSAQWDEVTLDALKQDALTSAQLAAANSGATAAKVAAWNGYAAQITGKADAADLRYRMVSVDEGQLVDRAWNNVELDLSTTAATLTLPSAVPRQGDDRYARDLLVSIRISDDRQLPFALTLAAPSGETARFFTDDGTIPQPDSKGEWLYSISEMWVGDFVVSCRKVAEVAQGGV